MREVIYKIVGIETKSYAMAQMLERRSGEKSKVVLRKVEEVKPQTSPMRKAMLEQFGYVHPSLKDLVDLD